MPSINERVIKLEQIMAETVLPHIEASNATREEMRQDIGRILAVVTGAEKVGGFLKRYGPRAIVFGAGAMTTLGFGNQDLWKFIANFFG